MNKKSQIQFVHRLVVLLESGISLTEALDLIIQQEKQKKNLDLLKNIRLDVEKGIPLSKSIMQLHIKFDKNILSMMSFGESSGIFSSSLRQALHTHEKGNKIYKKLIGALVYPAFIAVATFGMTLFLVLYIFPKIIPLFSSMNISLPFLTRAVRALYEFLSHYGLILVGLLILGATFFIFCYKRFKKVRYQTQNGILKIPLLGELQKKYYIATSCRSIGTLLECGQVLPLTLSQVESATGNIVYGKVWNEIKLRVNEGHLFSGALREHLKLFPALVPDILAIGERTGTLATTCLHVSRIYEEELDDFVKQLGTVIEPMLMIAMGLIVGSVALSIILPIYEITNHLQH